MEDSNINYPTQEPFYDRIIEQLWAPNSEGQVPSVFAILDGARDQRIEPLVNNSQLEHSCLYSGKLSYALKRAAPHIVKLEARHAFTKTLLRLGWGNSWGIFAITYPSTTSTLSTMAIVRNNCRRIAKAEAPNGKALVFRYYDPRVANLILPVCNHDEIERIFGAACSLLMEDNDQLGWTIYRRGTDGSPLATSHSLPGDKINNSPSSLLSTITNTRAATPQRGTFHLRQTHIDAMQQKIDDSKFETVKQLYIESFLAGESSQAELSKEQVSVTPAEPIYKVGGNTVKRDIFLRLCFNKAQQFKLNSYESILMFIQLNQQYGGLFWLNSPYSWAKEILQSSRPEEAKIESIERKFSRLLMDRMWG